jgi:hypothetical protein
MAAGGHPATVAGGRRATADYESANVDAGYLVAPHEDILLFYWG